MSRRCFSDTPIEGDEAALAGAEAHHLLHVLRAAPGMRVTLFDGSGCEFDAEVTACRRATVELAVLERREVDRELPFELTLGVAIPKGDRQRWLVEKAVELGVTRLTPLATQRSEKHDAEKLARYVIEASKQCGRNRLMEIAPPASWNDWLTSGDAAGQPRRWVAHPGGASLDPGALVPAQPTFITIGPEGGFIETEAEAAVAAGWQLIGLGPRLLRIETAAVALAAMLSLAGDKRP
jgi:16S rRNA (uracil1498-N3)-methyltransferase